MADDAVTNLIVTGGAQYISTLTNAADAQDKLTASIRNAGSANSQQLNTSIQNLALNLDKSAKQSAVFTGALQSSLKQMGLAPELASQVTASIQKQTKAFQDNAKAIREANEASATRASHAAPGFDLTQRPQSVQDPTGQARRADAAQRLFAASNPDFVAKTANIPPPIGVDQNTQAIRQQGEAMDSTTRKGLTYLSSLSALHAASFLLTGSTFSTGFSIATLGLAFSQMAESGTKASRVWGIFGAGIGTAAALLNFFTSAMGQVIQIIEAGASTLVKFGLIGATALGAITVASVKLASGVEDVMAEIAAFGEPIVSQFLAIGAGITDVSRRFGQSAAQVAAGTSLFIRAGGDIRGAFAENIVAATEAITKLTIASRGELIPATAARTIVTVTNAFSEFKDNVSGAVDIIVGVAQKTALSFNEVTQALQQAAPTAALLKIPLLDLAATIGVLANNGLRGQVAGTGFKQVLLDLLNPSEKAKAKLQELGISIRDQNDNVRPLIDIFGDFQKALGDTEGSLNKTANASKAQALAIIFGSRANLAAAIIARTGAEEFEKLRAAIGAVSANAVVEILLSSTSAQVNILKTNVEALAQAFGGPLNLAVGSALKVVNQFVQGIDVRGFELAGQAIIAVFTGGGFSEIQQALNSLDNAQIRDFLTGILDTALSVRNAIVNNLIPAFQQAGTNISAAFGNVNISSTFQGISGAIVTVINAISRLVVFTSELISDFIKGNERGQEIRKTLDNIATVVKTALISSFTAFVITIATGIVAMQLFAGVLKTVIGTAADLDTAFKQRDLEKYAETQDKVNKSVASNADQLAKVRTQQAALKAEQERLVGPRQGVTPEADLSGAGLPSREAMDRAFQIRDDLLPGLAREEAALIRQQQQLRVESEAANAAVAKAATNVSPLENVRAQMDAAAKTDFSKISQFLDGDLPAGLTALANQLREVQEVMNRGGGDRDPTEPAFIDDPDKQKKIQDDITDILRTAAKDRLNIEEDLGTKEVELRSSTIDRLVDIATKYNRDLDKLEKDRERRVRESNEQFQQQRTDRNTLQTFQRGLDLEDFQREQSHAKRDQLIQQEDAAEDRRNQRRVQDQDTVLSKLQDREQRAQDVINQIRDRGFQRQQQDQERAFGKRQDLEELSFTRQLQEQATARDNALKFREAKTPEERTSLTKQIREARENTTFQRGQEDQLRAFRERQETARIGFGRTQEDQAFQRSLSNEQELFEFKVALELRYLALRRTLEDTETSRLNGVEYDRLLRRLGFQKLDFDYRIKQSDRLQTEQDRLADEQQGRTTQRINDEAAERKTELGQRASEDIFGLFDDSARQSAKNQEQSLRQLRNVDQRAREQLQKLTEREPTAINAAQIAFLELDRGLLVTDFLIQKATFDAMEFFDVLRNAALVGQELPLEAPRRQLNLTVPAALTPDQQATINQARAFDVYPLLAAILPPTVAASIAAVQQEGIGAGARTLNINGAINDPRNLYKDIQNFFFNSR